MTDLLDYVKRCCLILDEKKGVDIKVLDVSNKSNLTDYFIIATAVAEPHLKAMSNALSKELKGKVFLLGVDYQPESGWLVIDGIDFIVHLFMKDTRKEYGLEQLWRDAKELDWQKIGEKKGKKPKL